VKAFRVSTAKNLSIIKQVRRRLHVMCASRGSRSAFVLKNRDQGAPFPSTRPTCARRLSEAVPFVRHESLSG